MADDGLIAFIDESLKPVRHPTTTRTDNHEHRSIYAAAAAIVFRDIAETVRGRLEEIAENVPGGLHYAALSRARRVEIATLVNDAPHWDALAIETDRPVHVRNDRTLRTAVLAAAFESLHLDYGINEVVIESRSHPTGAFAKLDHDDLILAATLKQSGVLPQSFATSHERKSEPLLGLADIVVGARTDYLCGVDRTPWNVICHRVRVVSVPPRWVAQKSAEAPGH